MATPESDFEVAARIAHVEPLVGLGKKLQPAHTALLVIDMQNDFVASDGLVSRSGRDVSAAQNSPSGCLISSPQRVAPACWSYSYATFIRPSAIFIYRIRG